MPYSDIQGPPLRGPSLVLLLIHPLSPARTRYASFITQAYLAHISLCILLRLILRLRELPVFSLALFVGPPLTPTPPKFIILSPVH